MREKTNIWEIQLLLLWLFLLNCTPIWCQQSSLSTNKQDINGRAISSTYIQAPIIKKLAPPFITKAGPPQIISLITPTKKLGEIPTEQLPISKTINIGSNGSVQLLIVPLVGQQKLAGIPDKVAAQKPFKKNVGTTNLRSYDLTNGIRDLTVSRQYQDQSNNLWTSSIYSGAYKFDGKYFHYFTEADLSIIKNSPFQHHSILYLLLFWDNNLTIWDNSFNFIDS